jgi:multiple sugar transport system permease protein
MEELKNEISEETNSLSPEEVVENTEQAPATENTAKTVVMHERNIQQVTSKQRAGKVLVQVGLYLFLGIMALIVLFPFYWMIISSLKTLNEYELRDPTFFPKVIHWQNYTNAFQKANMGRLLLNTVYVGIMSTALSLVITILSAFAFARLEFKGKNALFGFLLATMMIPGELFTITNYITVNRFGWMHTFTALIVPFLVSVFYIYLLKQNFQQIPNELYLAAKIDGTTDLKYLWKVMIPLALPTIISITILKMMGAWNSYMWPKLVANDELHRLITNGLREMDFSEDGNQGRIDYPRQMAAVAMVSFPLFMVFVFLRKYIMKGVSRSGIKG